MLQVVADLCKVAITIIGLFVLIVTGFSWKATIRGTGYPEGMWMYYVAVIVLTVLAITGMWIR